MQLCCIPCWCDSSFSASARLTSCGGSKLSPSAIMDAAFARPVYYSYSLVENGNVAGNPRSVRGVDYRQCRYGGCVAPYRAAKGRGDRIDDGSTPGDQSGGSSNKTAIVRSCNVW